MTMAREWAILTTESAYGTLTDTPVLNTDYIALRLDQGNSLTIRKTPAQQVIRTHDTLNRRAFRHSERYSVGGTIRCLAYATHLPLLLPWALQPINGAQDSPWTTTEQPNDLASCTLDHTMEDSSGNLIKTRYSGLKVASGELVFNNQTDIGVLTLQVVGKSATTHSQTEPAYTAYPSDVYCLQDLTTFKIASATTNFRQFTVRWNNMLRSRYDEAATLSSCRMRGRDLDYEAVLLLKSSPARRTAFEGLTAQDCEFVWNNGSNTMTFDFNGNSYIDSIQPETTPLEDEFEQTLLLHSHYDGSAGTDLSLSFT